MALRQAIGTGVHKSQSSRWASIVSAARAEIQSKAPRRRSSRCPDDDCHSKARLKAANRSCQAMDEERVELQQAAAVRAGGEESWVVEGGVRKFEAGRSGGRKTGGVLADRSGD